MENMTELTKEMYHSATHVQTVDQAASILLQHGNFRTLGDILTAFCGEQDPKTLLVDGLMTIHTDANRDSVSKKVRNWLSGRTAAIEKHDAFILCLVLQLSLERADEFLKLVTGEGIHWRDPEEIIFGYCIEHKLSYSTAQDLMGRLAQISIPLEENTDPGNSYTADTKEKLQAVFWSPPEELLEHLARERENLGAYHNTAHRLFMQYMHLLEAGGTEFWQEGANKMTAREILEQYMYRQLVPVAKRGQAAQDSAFSSVQRNIRANWPDEVTLSRMKNRELDIPRKVLILLFLATDGCETEYEDDEYEEILSRDEMFRNIYLRINRMLHACGFQALDPRSPFDWMILYSICVDDLWDMDQRLRNVLISMFPDGNEK